MQQHQNMVTPEHSNKAYGDKAGRLLWAVVVLAAVQPTSGINRGFSGFQLPRRSQRPISLNRDNAVVAQ